MKPAHLLAFLWPFAALAQQAPPAPDTLVSPEPLTGHRTAFRIRAPQASSVTLSGDWMPANTQEKLTKDPATGIWSITLDNIPPSIHVYTFNVDGITMADPVNPRIKLRSRTSASMVEIPSDNAAPWQERDVPHGTVTINWQKSSVINGETRQVWVYTPPNYEKESSRRYPVLYLFHGSNDTAAGWTTAGNANFILDNLIADKRATPMIVVMPYGHAVPFTAPRDQQARNTALYEQYVLKDVIPMIESRYRVAPGKPNRAIAGLSMGGGQSLTIGFDHPELFTAVAAFSAAVPADFATRFATTLDHSADTNAQYKLIWIGCGREDSLFPRSEALSKLLADHHVKHVFHPTPGAHTYQVWRDYLGEVVPLLFRSAPATEASTRNTSQ